MKLTNSFTVILICAVSLTATTYYVDKDGVHGTVGNDSYPGTSWDQPWATISKAAQTMVAGDSVIVAPALYEEEVTPENSGTSAARITYVGEPGAILEGQNQGSSPEAFRINQGIAYTTIDGFECQHYHETIFIPLGGPGIEIKNCILHDGMVGIWGGTTELSISSCEVYTMQGAGIVFDTLTADVVVENCVCHDMPDPTDGDGYAISDHTVTNITYRNCIAYDCGEDGFDCKGRECVFINCIAHDCGNGYKLWHGDTLINCIAYSNNGYGFGTASSGPDHPCVLINCSATQNGHGFMVRGEDPSSNPVFIRNCVASENSYYALNIDNPTIVLDADYNCWYESGSGYVIDYEPNGQSYTCQDINDGTWYDETGNGEHSQSYDPKFVGSDDVHLQPNSPCIDCGTSDGAPAYDADGNPRYDEPSVLNTGGGTFPYYDMGAYEFQGTGIHEDEQKAAYKMRTSIVCGATPIYTMPGNLLFDVNGRLISGRTAGNSVSLPAGCYFLVSPTSVSKVVVIK